MTSSLTDKQESLGGSLKTLPPSQESSNGDQSASVTATTKPKKKIVLVRKKSLKPSEKLPVKPPAGDQKAAGTLNADREKGTEMLGTQNGKLEQIAAEYERHDSAGRGEVKRRKLLQTSDEGTVAPRSIVALSASTQKVGSPPDLDVVCVERSVPLEEEQRAEETEQLAEPGASEDTTGEKILQRLSSGEK